MWCNINYYKDYNLQHEHFDAYNKLSGVYYVKAPKDCGKLQLYHPSRLVEHSWGVKISDGHHTPDLALSCVHHEAPYESSRRSNCAFLDRVVSKIVWLPD